VADRCDQVQGLPMLSAHMGQQGNVAASGRGPGRCSPHSVTIVTPSMGSWPSPMSAW